MLSPVIKKKIQERYKQEIKYAKQAEALAAHINETCKCNISASTIKRLWGFIKLNDFQPRIWTLDIIAEYIGYKGWEDLQDDLAGNKSRKHPKIEAIDCSQVKPGKKLSVYFGKATFISLEALGRSWFIVTGENKSSLNTMDEVSISSIHIHLPINISKIKRQGALLNGFVFGGVTGVTQIIDLDESETLSIKRNQGILTSKSK